MFSNTRTESQWLVAFATGLALVVGLASIQSCSGSLGTLTPQNSDIIYYHDEQTVDPATVTDLTLYDWGFALGLPINQSVIDNATTAQGSYFGGSPTKKTYFFDAAMFLLKENNVSGAAVLLPPGLDLDGTEYVLFVIRGLKLASAPMTPYVVKGVEEELVMNVVTDPSTLNALQTSLPIDMSIQPPSLTYDASRTALVGPLPTTAELKVIKGEILN